MKEKIMDATDDQDLLIVASPSKQRRRSRPRLLFANGNSNVRWLKRGKRVSRGWTPDIFTILVEIRWRWLHAIFFVTFVVSWFIFALFWWAIAYAHGDLDIVRDPQSNANFCVTEVTDMISAFMFSLETQYTTGYGSRTPTTECPEAIFLLSLQSIFGLLLQTILTGVIFAKLTRPKCRTQTILFSNNAVIMYRDGHLYLVFRVGDPCSETSHVGVAKAKAWIIKDEVTPEGEFLTTRQKQLKLNGPCFLFYPTLIEHRIDENSPLYDTSAMDCLNSKFEILISLEGVVETTGQNTEVRKSYQSTEVLWGHRFRETVKRGPLYYQANLDKFHLTYAVDTPLCSARQLEKMKESLEKQQWYD